MHFLLSLLLLGCFSVQLSAASSLEDSLKPLYSATESFLDTIQPPEKSILLKDVSLLLISGNISSIITKDWMNVSRSWLNSYLGYTILLCIGLFLILVIPLAGCCICCCRVCCSKCGGRLNYMEHKGASCKRVTYGTLLLIFATAMLFGSVFALLANQQLRDQLSSGKAFANISGASSRIADSLETAVNRGRNATPGVIDNLANNLRPKANATLQRFQQRLSGVNVNDSVINATSAFLAFGDAIGKFRWMQNRTSDVLARFQAYIDSITALNRTITDMKQNLTQPQFVCPNPAQAADCHVVNYTLQNFSGVEDNFNPVIMQSLTDFNHQLVKVNSTALLAIIKDGEGVLANVTAFGMDAFEKYIAEAQSNLNRNNSQIMSQWATINQSLTQLSAELRRYGNISAFQVFNPISRQEEPVWEMASYFDSFRYYICIGLVTFCLLLVLLLYMGLLFGCAGEPPFEDSGCCNRGVGANCLLASVGLGCLFYALLMLIAMLFFLGGGLAETEVCRYVSGRTGNYGYSLLDEFVNRLIERNVPSPQNLSLHNLAKKPVSMLLSGCEGQTLAEAIDLNVLSNYFGLPDLINRFINQTVNSVAKQVSDYFQGLTLNASELRNMQELSKNATLRNFTQFETHVRKVLPDFGLASLLAALANISRHSAVPENARYDSLHNNLATAVANGNNTGEAFLTQLRTLDSAVADLNTSLASLTLILTKLESNLRSPAILSSLIHQSAVEGGIGSAEQLLNQTIFPALAGLLSSALDCRSLGASLRSIVGTPCVSLLRPFNGFWAGYGLCLICLLPCLILAIKLANLYRKTQKYLPDFEDGNPKPI